MMIVPKANAIEAWSSHRLPEGKGTRFVGSSCLVVHLGGRFHEAG